MSISTTDAPTSALWQDLVYEQIQEVMTASVLDETAIATRPWLVIGFDTDEKPTLLARCETSDQADEEAVLHASKGYEHIKIAQLADVGFEIPAAPLEPTANPDAGELFDSSDYEREGLAIPKIDGEQITKIRFDFAGSVLLDRSAIADVAMFNGAKLGKEVELRCAGKIVQVGTGYTTNKDGDLDVVVGTKKLKIDSVWILDPEQL